MSKNKLLVARKGEPNILYCGLGRNRIQQCAWPYKKKVLGRKCTGAWAWVGLHGELVSARCMVQIVLWASWTPNHLKFPLANSVGIFAKPVMSFHSPYYFIIPVWRMKGNRFIKLTLWLQLSHLGRHMALFQISVYQYCKIPQSPRVIGRSLFYHTPHSLGSRLRTI